MKEKIKLQYPVEISGVKVDELSMRRPKVKDQLAAALGTLDPLIAETRLIANLCEVEPAVVEDLDLADYQRVQDVLRDFLSSRPTI